MFQQALKKQSTAYSELFRWSGSSREIISDQSLVLTERLWGRPSGLSPLSLASARRKLNAAAVQDKMPQKGESGPSPSWNFTKVPFSCCAAVRLDSMIVNF